MLSVFVLSKAPGNKNKSTEKNPRNCRNNDKNTAAFNFRRVIILVVLAFFSMLQIAQKLSVFFRCFVGFTTCKGTVAVHFVKCII